MRAETLSIGRIEPLLSIASPDLFTPIFFLYIFFFQENINYFEEKDFELLFFDSSIFFLSFRPGKMDVECEGD